MAFLDVRSDEIERGSRYPTLGAIEATRSGYILANDARAYQDWSRRYGDQATSQTSAEYRAALAKLGKLGLVTVH
jgi:hypothetical protein